MSRLRLFLAWLVLAAIPLQGLAAASMLFCGMSEHHAVTQVAGTQQHDHSRHNDVAEVQVEKTAGSVGENLPDSSHKCGLCASCCHSIAIAESSQLAAPAPLPQAELAEPFVLLHVRPSQVPDKPPRA